MQTLADRINQELRKIVLEEISRISRIVCAGQIQDIAQYKFHCGQLDAYEKVIGQHQKDAEDKANKER